MSSSAQGVSVFVLPGPRIRPEESDALESVIRLELEAGLGRIILDFSRVAWVDSYFLGSLVELHRRAKGFGVPVLFCALPEKVAYQLRIMRLDQYFPIFDTVEAALAEGCDG